MVPIAGCYLALYPARGDHLIDSWICPAPYWTTKAARLLHLYRLCEHRGTKHVESATSGKHRNRLRRCSCCGTKVSVFVICPPDCLLAVYREK